MKTSTAKMLPRPIYFLLPFLFCGLCAHAQTLPPEELVARKAALQQALQAAEDNLVAARNRYERIKRLLETNDATRAQLETAQERVHTAEQQLQEVMEESAKLESSAGPGAGTEAQEKLTREVLTTRMMTLEQELASAKSAVALAERDHAKAKSDFDRTKVLFDRRDATRTKLEAAQGRLDTAQQQLEKAQAEIARIEDQLASTRRQLQELDKGASDKP